MAKRNGNLTVLSLGGSTLINNKKIDTDFLYKLIDLLEKMPDKYVIVVGGGEIARIYIDALKKEKITNWEKDILGIEITRLNAKLLIKFFGLEQEMPKNISDIARLLRKRKIVISGGMIPGTTTDGIAALIASRLKARQFVNITSVHGLFTKDPKKDKRAKLIKRISYVNLQKKVKRMREMPGQHFILDKLASKTIAEDRIKTCIVGKDIKNIEKCLKDREFIGTKITD